MASTALTSGLGLYFTFRARTASYRELLYERQTELVAETLETVAQVDALCGVVLTITEEPARKDAWKELQDQLSRLALLGARAAAFLPNHLYAAFGEYHGVAVRILVDSGRGSTDTASLYELHARSAKFMDLGRSLLGVEALSAENQTLVSKGTLERVAKTDVTHYLTVVKQAQLERRASE